MVYIGNQYLEYATEAEIIDDVKQHIRNLNSYMVFEGMDFSITGYEVVGSRTNGRHRSDSDLDVVVRYVGDTREYALHNCMNDPENTLFITDVRVDFIPTKEEGPAAATKLIFRG